MESEVHRSKHGSFINTHLVVGEEVSKALLHHLEREIFVFCFCCCCCSNCLQQANLLAPDHVWPPLNLSLDDLLASRTITATASPRSSSSPSPREDQAGSQGPGLEVVIAIVAEAFLVTKIMPQILQFTLTFHMCRVSSCSQRH